jgi:hypothetical protein
MAEPKNKNSLASLLGDAAGNIAPILGYAKAPQIAAGLLKADEALQPVAGRMLDKYMEKIGGKQNIFMGESSKTWNAADASKAKEMLKAGTDPRKVWQETGTWKAPDGKLRQEIADNNAWYDKDALGDLKALDNFDYLKNTQPLGGVLDHKGLYSAYPDASNIPVHFMPEGKMRGAYAAYSGPADVMTLADNAKNQTSGALHEMQHAIQQREGFAVGGSSQMAFNDPKAFEILAGLRKKMGSAMPVEQYAKDAWGSAVVTPEIAADYAKSYLPSIKKIPRAVDISAQETAAKEYYRRLAGEAEARATQARIPLNAAQRRALFPEDSYDVPLKDLIIRGAK